jgi:hypothetical protein
MNDVATKALQDQKVEINHQDSVNARAKMWGLNRAKLVSQLQDSGVIKKTTQYLNPHTGAWQDQYVSPEAEKNRDFKSYGNPNNPKEETTRTGYFSPTADTSALEHYMNVHGYGGDNRKLANPDKTIDSVGKIVAPVKVDTELLSLMSDMAERDYIHNVNLAHTTPEIHIHTGTLDGKTIGPMVAEHVKKALVDLMSGGTSNSYGEVAYAAN